MPTTTQTTQTAAVIRNAVVSYGEQINRAHARKLSRKSTAEERAQLLRITPADELEQSRAFKPEEKAAELARRHFVTWAHQFAQTPRS